MKTYKLEQFEGPLGLLLQMIQQEKLDISEISLATVADQFVKHIESNPHINGEELADFLVVASQLLLIKSKLLLPKLDFEEEIGLDALETQLKLYRRFVDAAKRLETKIAQHEFLYARKKSPLQLQPKFRPPEGLKALHLQVAMKDIIARLEPIVILPESVMQKTITMHEKIRHIQSLLKRSKGLSFKQLLKQARSKTEKVVSFLALLELVKQHEVAVQQANTFEDILINRP